MTISKQQFAEPLNVSIAQVDRQLASNIEQCEILRQEALKSGKKVRGATAGQWTDGINKLKSTLNN